MTLESRAGRVTVSDGETEQLKGLRQWSRQRLSRALRQFDGSSDEAGCVGTAGTPAIQVLQIHREQLLPFRHQQRKTEDGVDGSHAVKILNFSGAGVR